MAVYYCWFNCDSKEGGAKTISSTYPPQEVAEEFASWAWQSRDMWKLGINDWKNDYAVNIWERGSKEILTFNIHIWTSPNFMAELVKNERGS